MIGRFQPDSPWSLRDDRGDRWPVVAGIPFLRTGREALRDKVLGRLDATEGKDTCGALVALLGDQDDYARSGPPDEAIRCEVVRAVEKGGMGLCEAMRALRFGPVADYFAHRWSAPTYLSGLVLLDRFAPPGNPVIEVACGVGHFLRDLAMRGFECAGVDVVFAKLWLARRFVVPTGVGLVCGDAARGLPMETPARPGTAFCHDAFYFLPDKPKILEGMRRVAGPAGVLVIGHAHNRHFDHRGVAGEPLSPTEYLDLMPSARMYDDADLARSAWDGSVAAPTTPEALRGAEAVALIEGEGVGFGDGRMLTPPVGASLRLNPLLRRREDRLGIEWPSPQFEAEYAAESGFLRDACPPSRPGTWRAGEDSEVDRLARRRILLDLPERW